MMFRRTLILFLLVMLGGCKANSFYVSDYQLAQQNFPGQQIQTEQVKLVFEGVFTNMKSPGLAERVRAAYADNLYFNDTLHTCRALNELADYLDKTINRVVRLDSEINDVSVSGNDAYVRWTMTFQVNQNSQPLTSVGISHLRFDDQGKIILHQDYWDSVEGFYRNIPLIGGMVNGVRERL